MKSICHLTSVHPRFDTRIFFKECRSVAAAGHEAFLIVADGQPDQVQDGVRILGVARERGRMRRMLGLPRRILARALALDADIYHLHDPELLTIALGLKRAGKKVVFDAHEDLPKQIIGKHYLWPPVRSLVSRAAGAFERYVCSRLDAVVAATPAIRDKFLAINPRTVDINNYPLLSEFNGEPPASPADAPAVCYVGGISALRGIRELVQAMALTVDGTRLLLAGTFMDPATADEVRAMAGWSRVDALGWLNRAGVRDAMGRSMAGIVTLMPTPAYVEALPVKMFEYMGAGIPVIASDFPLWREIVTGNDCGLCVDPMAPGAIAGAIDWIVAHPAEARRMGENGRRAVLGRYNWQVEERKLLDLYARLA